MTDHTPSLDLPEPPVPSDLDTRDLWWMPLDIGALLNSDFNAMTRSDTAWRAGVTLWAKAWHQVPAGSLPDDERALCYFAGFGRDVRRWRKHRDEALHGFVRCADGRLYHPFLCAKAVEARKLADDNKARREAFLQRDRERHARKAGGTDAETVGKADGADTEATGNSTPLQDSTLQDQDLPPKPPSMRHRVRVVTGTGRRRRHEEPPERVGIGGTSADDLVWRNRLSSGPGGLWLSSWGPPPDEPGCEAPAALVRGSPWGREVQRMAA